MSTPALPIEQIPLPHLPRELAQIVEPGQDIPGHRRLYHEIGLGELPMIVFIRGRWYCPRPELPALAQKLGLQLRIPTRLTERAPVPAVPPPDPAKQPDPKREATPPVWTAGLGCSFRSCGNAS